MILLALFDYLLVVALWIVLLPLRLVLAASQWLWYRQRKVQGL